MWGRYVVGVTELLGVVNMDGLTITFEFRAHVNDESGSWMEEEFEALISAIRGGTGFAVSQNYKHVYNAGIKKSFRLMWGSGHNEGITFHVG
jgi:hypothetical protein